jgi:hypothetical protein
MAESRINGPGGFRCVVPFLIDGDGYSDRDREMFVLGFEFATVREELRPGHNPPPMTIHRDNETRIRVMFGRSGRRCTFTPINEEWVRMEVEPVPL